MPLDGILIICLNILIITNFIGNDEGLVYYKTVWHIHNYNNYVTLYGWVIFIFYGLTIRSDLLLVVCSFGLFRRQGQFIAHSIDRGDDLPVGQDPGNFLAQVLDMGVNRTVLAVMGIPLNQSYEIGS